MKGLREVGTDVLVSMLTSDETDELDLQGEMEAATAAGLVFLTCPTLDRGIPETQRFRDLLAELQEVLAAGHNVVVHCRMGIGRSSLVEAALLVGEGMTVPDAFAAVATARTGHRGAADVASDSHGDRYRQHCPLTVTMLGGAHRLIAGPE